MVLKPVIFRPLNLARRCEDQGAVRTDEPIKPWHDHPGWCAFGGSLVVQVPWSLLHGQAVGDIDARINLARVTFNRLYTSLWSRHDISRRTKGRIYESVVRTILLYDCETWPLRVEDQRRLEVFDNDCLRRILGRRRLGRVPCAVLRRQLHLRALPPVLLQR